MSEQDDQTGGPLYPGRSIIRSYESLQAMDDLLSGSVSILKNRIDKKILKLTHEEADSMTSHPALHVALLSAAEINAERATTRDGAIEMLESTAISVDQLLQFAKYARSFRTGYFGNGPPTEVNARVSEYIEATKAKLEKMLEGIGTSIEKDALIREWYLDSQRSGTLFTYSLVSRLAPQLSGLVENGLQKYIKVTETLQDGTEVANAIANGIRSKLSELENIKWNPPDDLKDIIASHQDSLHNHGLNEEYRRDLHKYAALIATGSAGMDAYIDWSTVGDGRPVRDEMLSMTAGRLACEFEPDLRGNSSEVFLSQVDKKRKSLLADHKNAMDEARKRILSERNEGRHRSTPATSSRYLSLEEKLTLSREDLATRALLQKYWDETIEWAKAHVEEWVTYPWETYMDSLGEEDELWQRALKVLKRVSISANAQLKQYATSHKKLSFGETDGEQSGQTAASSGSKKNKSSQLAKDRVKVMESLKNTRWKNCFTFTDFDNRSALVMGQRAERQEMEIPGPQIKSGGRPKSTGPLPIRFGFLSSEEDPAGS